MNRIEILNSLIIKHGYKRYLEIGVRDGSCFNAINCEYKVGVDPDQSSAATSFLTSDEFFKIRYDEKWDIIFIDGLHEFPQVTKDIINSLAVLNEGGTILMHDCLPTSEFMTLVPQRPDHNEWTGDTYKSFLKLRTEREDLEMAVCDVDWGCGLIRPGKQNIVTLTKSFDEITYQDFVENKLQWMNVLSADLFKQKYLD